MRRLKCTDVQSNPTLSLQKNRNHQNGWALPPGKEFKDERSMQKVTSDKTSPSSSNYGYPNATCF